ncbi:MAG: DinB family protein [Phycisphaerales bacterium]|nr:DinB family protein [Phycisphaerales bacterium]
MSGPDSLARAIEATEGLLLRFVADVDDDMRAVQSPGLPNHFIWVLGHCSMTMNRLASLIDGTPLPDSDFFDGDGVRSDAGRFDAELVRFDSTPRGVAEDYPTMDRGRAVYAAACRRLAAVVRALDESELESTLDWHGAPVRIDDLVVRVGFHNGAHAGQVLDLRRVLGMPRIIG